MIAASHVIAAVPATAAIAKLVGPRPSRRGSQTASTASAASPSATPTATQCSLTSNQRAMRALRWPASRSSSVNCPGLAVRTGRPSMRALSSSDVSSRARASAPTAAGRCRNSSFTRAL